MPDDTTAALDQPLNSLAEGFETQTTDAWRAAVDRDLKGAPFEKKLVTHTYEHIDIQPLYTDRDYPNHDDPGGFPGSHPFTRGATTMATSRFGWDIRQEFAEPDPETANAAILADLEGGVTTVHLRFDLAARNGIDPGSEHAADYSGVDGITLYSADDLERALQGVRLDIAGVALEAGAAALPATALLLAVAARRGVDTDRLRFDAGADPLAVLARDGSHPGGLDGAFAAAAEIAVWTNKHAPQGRAMRVGTAPYHHAGATAAQDIAFALATGVAYLRVLTNAGLTTDEAAQQLRFNIAVGCNFFLAGAKLRAARRLWDRVLTACGTNNADSRMRLHVKPSKRVMTQRDPWVNILRNTATCFAASVGGAESITTFPFDGTLADPTEQARRLARNTQLILTEECNLHRVIDPAGGSWFIESLTDQLAERAWEVFRQIETRGGMAEALRSGWIHEQIDSAFKEREHRIATRRDAIVGVSEFPDAGPLSLGRDRRDPEALREQAEARLNQREVASDVGDLLAKLTNARTGQRLNVAARAAASGATISQLFNASQPAESEAITPISPAPYAAPFEALRDATDFAAQSGIRPRVFLVNLGPVAAHTARANFSRNFFEAGGFDVIESPPLHDGVSAAQALRDSGASIACICSSDPLYEDLVWEVVPQIRRAGARTVVLAGHPGPNEAAYREAGVGRFIFIKCNVLQTLTELLEEEDVLS